jgi:hypothetical protein
MRQGRREVQMMPILLIWQSHLAAAIAVTTVIPAQAETQASITAPAIPGVKLARE